MNQPAHTLEPALRFSQGQGLLEVKAAMPLDSWAVQSLYETPGVHLSEEPAALGVTIELASLQHEFEWEGDKALEDLLRHLGSICAHKAPGDVDRVAELGNKHGKPSISMYASFQEWLNGGITEEQAMMALEAMALALPHRRKLGFVYQPFPESGEVGAILAPIGELQVLRRQFSVYRGKAEGRPAKAEAVTWANVGLTIEGEPGQPEATLGGHHGTGSRVVIDPNAPARLYTMYTSANATIRQQWGLLFSMATLAASAASEQSGPDDIRAAAA